MRASAGQGSAHFESKLVGAEQALAAIRPGSRIYLGTGCAAPRTLLAALEAMDPGPADLEFVSFLTTSAVAGEPGAPGGHYRHRTFFVGSDVRGLAGSGRLDYVPISLDDVPALLASGRLPIDVALLQVSLPDARGFVSLGVSVDLAPAVLGVARQVIAEVNPAMPRTHGESFVHLDRFDAMLTQVAVAVVHLDRLRPQALALFVFTTAFAATVTLIGLHERPFSHLTIDDSPLRIAASTESP